MCGVATPQAASGEVAASQARPRRASSANVPDYQSPRLRRHMGSRGTSWPSSTVVPMCGRRWQPLSAAATLWEWLRAVIELGAAAARALNLAGAIIRIHPIPITQDLINCVELSPVLWLQGRSFENAGLAMSLESTFWCSPSFLGLRNELVVGGGFFVREKL